MTSRTVIVATDGSALKNPNGPAGWAWYVDKERWSHGSLPKASNQVAELYAIMTALKDIPSHIPIHIKTDSSFWVKTMGEDAKSGWMFGWKRRGWIKPDGKVPANLKHLRILDKLLSERRASTRLEWVKGHNGHLLNEIADKLCTRASASQAAGKPIKQGGPGWGASKGANSATSPRPSTAPKKAAPVRRQRKAPEYLVSLMEDDDDAPMMPAKKRERLGTYCDSCDRPINLDTGECSCSD